MAPRRPSALDNPPSASPSSEDEESEEVSETQQPENPSDSEESEGETSEEERETSEKPENEEEEGSEEGSETESDTTPSVFTVKPAVVSKSSPKPNKLSAPKAAPKQASADLAKKPNGEPKKSPIVRIWTEEGELAALKAMLEYKSKKGLDPYADTAVFFEFAKKTIPVEVTRNQVMDKIRRLRKKYENNAQKGEDPVFTKAHEQKAFEISKKIWGGAAAESGGGKSGKRKAKGVLDDSVEKGSNKKAKKEKPLELIKDDAKEILVEEGAVGECFWVKYPRLKEAIEGENNGFFVKDGKKATDFDLSKMGDAKAKELDDKWKRYQAKEAELKLLKLELVTEQTKVVLGELMKF